MRQAKCVLLGNARERANTLFTLFTSIFSNLEMHANASAYVLERTDAEPLSWLTGRIARETAALDPPQPRPAD